MLKKIQWQHIDNHDKEQVQEKKIRVVYLAPEGAEKPANTPLRNTVNGTNGTV
jgi:hypothetical protein